MNEAQKAPARSIHPNFLLRAPWRVISIAQPVQPGGAREKRVRGMTEGVQRLKELAGEDVARGGCGAVAGRLRGGAFFIAAR